MTFKRAIIWGIVIGVAFGGLTFAVACGADRPSAMHLTALSLHWPVFSLIEWIAYTFHGSADAGLLYLPLIPLYWITVGFTCGCLTWAVSRHFA